MLALILARGGSKGLPRKNVLPLNGKPLIAHTIIAGLSSSVIDKVVVSTDDPEIATVSREYGADVPFERPADLASDTASARDAIIHALDFLEDSQQKNIDYFCLLQPTSPLRTAEDIDSAYKIFKDNKADSVLSITEYDHPVQWAVDMGVDGVISCREQNDTVRRQDLPQYYRPNGAIYIFKSSFFRTCPDYISARSYGYLMPAYRSIDIDTRLDLLIAETVTQHIQELSDV